jgi:hypothetical protein
MKQRCFNKRDPSFKNYGGRGITVCERWMSFSNFIADMGPKPSIEMTVERKDNDGNYEPSNCRWATRVDQTGNTRRTRWMTVGVATKPAKVFAREKGLHYMTVISRLNRGESDEMALRPVQPR